MADFAVDLKRLSSTCKFNDFLDQALCMQFVVRLNMPKVQSKVMQERTLAFDDAVKIAIAESSAVASCANIDTMRGEGSAEDGTVHRVFSKGRGTAQNHSKVCWRCGNGGHTHTVRTTVVSGQWCVINANGSDTSRSDATT